MEVEWRLSKNDVNVFADRLFEFIDLEIHRAEILAVEECQLIGAYKRQ